MDNEKFAWVKFYMALAGKLLPYAANRSALVEKVKAVFQKAAIPLPTLEEDNNVFDIDPFTTFGLFNKGITNDNRIKIIKAFAEVFAVEEPVPTVFDGIPVVNNLKATFYWFKNKRQEHDIDNLWTVFLSAIEYADKQNSESREKLIQSYDTVRQQVGIKWNLTMGLYWIRPLVYINLDSNNRRFISKPEFTSQAFTDSLPMLYKGDSSDKVPSGREYLNICNNCKTTIATGSFSYKTLPEMSAVAFATKIDTVTPEEQKFKNWLTVQKSGVKGKELKSNYITNMVSAIKKVCSEIHLADYPDITNLYSVTDLNLFYKIRDAIMNSADYEKVNKKYGNGALNSALTIWYEEYLKWLAGAGSVHYWTYAPGEQACMWETFYEKQIMGIGWPELGDLNQYKSKEELQQKMGEVYEKESSFKNSVLAVWQFVNELKVGDIVYVKQGVSKILGYGEVISEYEYNEAYDKEYPNIRRMSWKAKGSWDFEEKLAIKTLTDITGYKKLEDLRFKLVNSPEPPNDCQYWWLNANPKIWSFSSLTVGETQAYTIFNENGKPRRIPKNFAEIKQGDKLIGYESTPVKKVVALGEVTNKDEKEVTFKKTETINSAIEYKILKEQDELQEMEFFKNAQGSLFKLTKEEYDCILDLIREANPQSSKVYKSYSREDFLAEVFMTAEEYDEIVSVLEDKKNIILQGAPGVGKTFAATRLAYAIMEQINDDQIKSVQFHQNYSYEDFIMGYKPDGEGFILSDGIFYKFCKEAENHSDKKYFFIIDEINRGNMSKIFGELLSRIENGYRGKKITLAYKDEQFSVPANLYLIGLMNTADRSLAMIDYALRRRFSFFDMEPGFDTEGFQKIQKELGQELFNSLILKIKELNKEIEKDKTLGSGFCIGHSYFCDLKKETCTPKKLLAIVKRDILPMLKEYWFDEQDKYEHWENQLLGLFK